MADLTTLTTLGEGHTPGMHVIVNIWVLYLLKNIGFNLYMPQESFKL